LRRYPLLTIVVLAVVLRLFLSMGVMRGALHVLPQNEITDGYDKIAENLFAGHGYREFADLPPTVQRPPGYPLFLLGLFHIFGVHYLWVQIVQALLGGVGCILLHRFGRWIHSETLGLSAAFLYAVYPNSIEYAARLYAENVYIPIFLAFGYFLCRAWKSGSRRDGLLAGIFWAAGLLCRGTLLAFPVVLAAALVASAGARAHIRRHLRWLVPAVAASAVVLAPWIVRNERLTGAFIPVSAWTWSPFYHGIQCSKRMLAWDDLARIDKEADTERYRITVDRLYGGDRSKAWSSSREQVRQDGEARVLVLAELRRDPIGAVARSAIGIPFTWFQTLGRKMRVVSLLVHLPLVILLVVGIRGLAERSRETLARGAPALALIVFVNLLQAIVFPHVRYMSPAIALSFVFAGFPIAEALRRRGEA
jgi:4-amino-4-deoxy-L-arabinose transferase-like glycosyltransferase